MVVFFFYARNVKKSRSSVGGTLEIENQSERLKSIECG